jgi:hypothetical protein
LLASPKQMPRRLRELLVEVRLVPEAKVVAVVQQAVDVAEDAVVEAVEDVPTVVPEVRKVQRSHPERSFP